ncbi:uncharacterized protein LOC120466694 [Pimephales promelas]|uniref:uncharacterized protein LOC120466694 n=1 Tax=Pimephales promelas TaxID=90988 RepID=UPI0019558A31|nr:uncharacterized protein LOC120466694 [Pimephales promelas]XP_039511205.1 uncharacterized protein LOC120466694 [Pimephales promelas]KAG1960373.1 hypothetical protein F2P79_006265 [Pimephales promelas]
MAFIKEENETKIEETFTVKLEDTEDQTKMVCIKESEDMKIEDTEEQTILMVLIKEESEETNIEEAFRVKQETEEQTNMVFMEEESEETNIEEAFTVKQEDKEERTNVVFIKESEETNIEEAFTVIQDDTDTLADCPLCLHGYHKLSQHLRVTHKVINSQERKLLLAISSGRVDVRKGTCPLPSCGKSTSRLDRHLKDHTELTREAQQETMQALKRKKIIHDLTYLRASNPAVPMASTLDLEEDQDLENAPPPPEESTCDKPCCQHARKQLQDQVAELNRQVDTLRSTLRDVKRRYRLLKRRSQSIPSTQVSQVTRKLLTPLRSPEKEVEATVMEKSLRRKVVVHEVALNQAKEGCLIPKRDLRECRSSAKRKIPEILASLRKSGDKKDQWSFYGHLTAYLACIYGHHVWVFQNITIKEVEEGQRTAREGSYVINISSHKINPAFWDAQLALDAEEYGWLQDFLSMRSTLVGGKNAHYLFFTSKASSCKNLNKYFQEAWAGMGLLGTPTFTDIRTSIATHAKNTLSPGDWYKVARYMCYDTSTVDGFNVLNLNAKQVAEHHHLFESAVECEETIPVKNVKTRKRPATFRLKRGKRPCKRAASPSTSFSPSPSATLLRMKEGPESRESASEGQSQAKRQIY